MTTKLFHTLAAATTLAGVIATAGTASAASLSYSYNTGGYDTADFDKTFNVKKFDSSLGTLKKVTVSFLADITGSGGIENKGSKSITPTLTLDGILTLQADGLTPDPLFELNPTKTSKFSLDKYDGIDDYAGTSGVKFDGLTASESGSKVFSDLSSLNVFTGKGTLNFLLSATAESGLKSSGNYSSLLTTLAKGSFDVTYEYDPKATPEPSALVAMGLVAGFGIMSNRKKQWLKTAKS
ncbi:choice-of-anchor E domain-containing protein [Nostoc sp. FACHB-110]|uniref:choice-of-anchor E domain-containing protein n=1 Tax=Nostoc sp. FACHB-110 TaxID=2692834 RepID=UPI0016830BD1|nr:PEP-CTERM sorting domain-containing protein [Nostoc sp. FACHB-110]MBD2440669.1 PEP-CTERM sorting domain-containing protein [Nostoc sp. FACHB-110]